MVGNFNKEKNEMAENVNKAKKKQNGGKFQKRKNKMFENFKKEKTTWWKIS